MVNYYFPTRLFFLEVISNIYNYNFNFGEKKNDIVFFCLFVFNQMDCNIFFLS